MHRRYARASEPATRRKLRDCPLHGPVLYCTCSMTIEERRLRDARLLRLHHAVLRLLAI
jgi:hypothetical protein